MEFDRVKFDHNLCYEIRMNGSSEITRKRVDTKEIQGNTDFGNFSFNNGIPYFEYNGIVSFGESREVNEYIYSYGGSAKTSRYTITGGLVYSSKTTVTVTFSPGEEFIRSFYYFFPKSKKVYINNNYNYFLFQTNIYAGNIYLSYPDSETKVGSTVVRTVTESQLFNAFWKIVCNSDSNQIITNNILGKKYNWENMIVPHASVSASNIWTGGWSEKFFLVAESDMPYRETFITGVKLNSSFYGENRIVFDLPTEDNKSIELKTLNNFPFKVNGESCFYQNTDKTIDFGNPTGHNWVKGFPMPTIDTTEIKKDGKTIEIPLTITYKTFDSPKSLKIIVKYKIRNCYALYDGITEKSVEYINSFSQLQKKDFTEDIYVVIE